MSVSKPTTLTRYCLFQIPGVVIAAALAWAAAHWFSVPIWAGILAVAIWIAKDVALYPILKAAYEAGGPSGPESMIGSVGTVTEGLNPSGFIRIGPELWCAKSAAPLAEGQLVRVIGCAGMTMLVEPSPVASKIDVPTTSPDQGSSSSTI